MALYFPSLLRDIAESRPILNDPSILRQAYDAYRGLPSALVVNYLLQTLADSSLGPVGWAAAAIQTALYLVDLFSQPTRIDVQKDAVEQYFDPLTHFMELNYCYPIQRPYFRVMESDEVQAAFDRRPDLRELRTTMYPQARSLVGAGVGLGGYGSHMNERIVNQSLGNWERHGWSTQQVVDGWQGILNAAEVGPQPNGPPPVDGAVFRAIAGMQVGAGLYTKWITRQKFSLEDWQMFADYYVQRGFDAQAGSDYWRTGWALRWDAIFYSPWPDNQPTIPPPQLLNAPQAVAWFSPPCLQTQHPYQLQPQTPYQRACLYWTLRYAGQAIPPDLALWATDPANSAAVLEASRDPACGYRQEQPPYPPIPPQPPYPPPDPQPPRPPPDPQPPRPPDPQPPSPTPYQRACEYWRLRYAGQPIPLDVLEFAADLANAAVMLQASTDPNCGYRQPGPEPPGPQPPTDYEQACQFWRLFRGGQRIPESLRAWVADPQHYPLLAQAMCDPQCGYDPDQPWPIPPDPQPPRPPDDQCPSPCQEQIDLLKDQVQRTRPPWQRQCDEWPPRRDDQDCWQWPWPQQPWPPKWPQPWPCEWPPQWPKPPCDCPPPPPDPPPPPPPEPPYPPPPDPPIRPPWPPGPPGPPTPPPPEGCSPEYVQNFWQCIWPDLRDRICEVARECQRQLECVRIRWCEIARLYLGNMLECWLLKDTPEAPEPEPDEYETLTMDGLKTMVSQGIGRQRSGEYAEAILYAEVALKSVLAGGWPQDEEEEENPAALGFGTADEQAEILIRTVRPSGEERDPCQQQGLR